MRIIAGSAGGRAIITPKGMETRPTQDYVRESLFNILARDVPGATVLDLFAGSGALALEALSRGAESAVLADCSAQAIACIQQNVTTLRFSDQAQVVKGDWQATLRRLAAEKRAFDLVFLDPPYRLESIETICEQLADLSMLANGALIVIERARGQEPQLGEHFKRRDARNYGDTEITFFTWKAEVESHA